MKRGILARRGLNNDLDRSLRIAGLRAVPLIGIISSLAAGIAVVFDDFCRSQQGVLRQEIGPKRARFHDRYVNSKRLDLCGKRLRQPLDSKLGGVVSAEARNADEAADR